MSKRTATWLLLLSYLVAAGFCIFAAVEDKSWWAHVDAVAGVFFLWAFYKRVRRYADG